jgi:hypothetical protein
MGGMRKRQVDVQSCSEEDNSVAELGNAVIGSAHDLRDNAIPDLCEFPFNEMTEIPFAVSQKALHILHHEEFGLNLANEANEMMKQKVARIVLNSLPVGAEPLATRTSGDQIDFTIPGRLADFRRRNISDVLADGAGLRMIRLIRRYRVFVEVDAIHGLKACELKPL